MGTAACFPVSEPGGESFAAVSFSPHETASPTAPSFSPEPTRTPSPTAAPTQEPFIPKTVEEAIARYEAVPLDYVELDREDVPPNRPLLEPRYTLGEDGIYHSSDSTGSGEAVIIMTGDLMCQTRQQEAARTETGYDFNASFDFVRDFFSTADLLVGNLEATVTPTSPYMAEIIKVENYPHLNAPVTFLEAMRYAGYDLAIMANNHNCDTGVRGVYDTLDRVDEYGLVHTGLFRNPSEPRHLVLDVEGIRVGYLCYATYFNNKEYHYTSEGQDALLSIYSKERFERDMAAVRAAGAEYVIVYMHWGLEYQTEPYHKQYNWAQEIADAGADYIVGSHPHAIQPYDVLTAADGRSVPVIYSLGNFISHQKKNISKDTAILRIVLKRGEDGGVRLAEEGYLPAHCFVTFLGRPYAVVPITSPYNGGHSSKRFAPAYERITEIVGDKLPVLGTP